MPAVVATLVHAPSLEQLSSWGNLDALPWSLDGAIWPEADLLSLAIAEKATAAGRMWGGTIVKRYAAGTAASSQKCVPLVLVKASMAFKAQSREEFPSVAIAFLGKSAESAVPLVSVIASSDFQAAAAGVLSGKVEINGGGDGSAVASEKCFSGIVFSRRAGAGAASSESATPGLLFTVGGRGAGASSEHCAGMVIINANAKDAAFSGDRLFGELRGHGWTRIPWDASGEGWRDRAV